MGRKPERSAERVAMESVLRMIAMQIPVTYSKFIESDNGNRIRYVKFGDGFLMLRDDRDANENCIAQRLIFGPQKLRDEPADLLSEAGLIDTLTSLKKKYAGKTEPEYEQQTKTAKA
jgi:hypothetical protein